MNPLSVDIRSGPKAITKGPKHSQVGSSSVITEALKGFTDTEKNKKQ